VEAGEGGSGGGGAMVLRFNYLMSQKRQVRAGDFEDQ